MEELINLGISNNTIKCMIELNPNIKTISNEEVLSKIQLLKFVNCSDRQIMNIISSNPLYLEKTNEKISELFNYLLEIGFKTLNILFDSNPYILNLDSFEIKKYIESRISNGEMVEDIVDDLDSNPYLFQEL